MLKPFFVFNLALLIALAAIGQRDTTPLNKNWQFAIDSNASLPGNLDWEKALKHASTVQLPHTWNIALQTQNYYGWAWYQKKINIPSNWKNKNVVLEFDGVNHTSIIYINNKKVAQNIGDGFNKMTIRLDSSLNYGKENWVTLAVNNDYGKKKVPYGSSFDWPNDGGLIRPARLIVSDKPAAAYIHVTPQLNVSNSQGHLKIQIGLDEKSDIKLKVVVREENQPSSKVVYSQTVKPSW